NPTKVASETAAAVRIGGDPQPSFRPSITAKTRAASVTIASTWPGMSIARPRGSADSGTTLRASTIASAQSGTFSQNTERQPRPDTRAPPITGPDTRASAETPAQTPIAWARSRASGKAWLTIASEVGSRAAAPTP